MSTFNARSKTGIGENTFETLLWRAVIARTIQEWISGTLRRQREAEQYLFQDNRDFPLVCESAGMDIGQLRSRLAGLRGHTIPDYILAAAA
jgi:predicted nucleic acid-binding protein